MQLQQSRIFYSYLNDTKLNMQLLRATEKRKIKIKLFKPVQD